MGDGGNRDAGRDAAAMTYAADATATVCQCHRQRRGGGEGGAAAAEGVLGGSFHGGGRELALRRPR